LLLAYSSRPLPELLPRASPLNAHILNRGYVHLVCMSSQILNVDSVSGYNCSARFGERNDDGIDRRPMTRLSPQFSSTLCRTHSQNFFDDTFSKESKDRCIFGRISVQAFNYNWRRYKHDIIQSNQSFE